MSRGGLFTGFEEFQVPSEADKRAALKDAVLAVDTNVLLNLYRYNRSTSVDLLTILEAIQDRLFVPHQVIREFWRNRQTVISGLGSATKDAQSILGKNRVSTQNAVREWAKRTALEDAALDGLLSETETFFAALQVKLTGEPSAVGADTATGTDWLLSRLETLLAGSVGPQLPDDQWKAAVEEGRRRVEECEPPGYRDAKKLESDLPEGASGDYLVWLQLLIEGAALKKDLILVLADTKEDWWWIERGKLVGPRRELVAEYLRETGCRLYFFTPTDLLEHSVALGVGTSEESLNDVERVQRDDVKREDVTAEATRARRARSVHVIVDNDLIEPDEILLIDLKGVVNTTLLNQVESWIALNPDRGKARWVADRHRPLRWCSDSEGAGAWTTTRLAQHIIAEATGSTERRTLSGPDVWVCNGRSLYRIASDFLDDLYGVASDLLDDAE